MAKSPVKSTPTNEDVRATPTALKQQAPGTLKAVEATLARHREALQKAAVPGAPRLSYDTLGDMATSLAECEGVIAQAREALR